MKNKVLLFILITLLLSSCMAESVGQTTPVQTESTMCLPVILPEGIYNGDEIHVWLKNYTGADKLEPVGWTIIHENDNNDEYQLVTPLFTQKVIQGERIFISRSDNKIGIVNTSTNEYSNLDISASDGVVDEEGIAWLYSAGIINNKVNMFRLTPDSDEIENITLSTDLERGRINQLVAGKGKFWMIVQLGNLNWGIGSFDPNSQEVKSENFVDLYEGEPSKYLPDLELSGIYTDEEQLSLHVEFNGLAVDRDGNPYFAMQTQKGDVYIFKVEKNMGKSLIQHFPYSKLNIDLDYFRKELFIDRNNRLWTSDYGWVNLTERDDYYANSALLYRSPVFVTNEFNPRATVVWARPSPTAATEDGRVWYQSYRGAAWFQPETGEWCVFSTTHSKVLEDNDGNLWMVYDNDLYMLPASETSKKE